MHFTKIIIVLLSCAFANCEGAPYVETSFGKIEGLVDVSEHGRTFYSFEGIPYARPPTGDYRFKESIPPQPWNGVWKADRKYECLQYNHMPRSEIDPVDGSEDCLYVNVYTPKLKASFDVFVYIHGGGFTYGSGQLYQPHFLLDRDVVVVTINYRLGPLGFLSTEDDVVPGNNGLKDQILALKWIKENIKYFGGNPNSITISGTSAGGASVHFHTLSEKSKGLFNRAISMSGCMLSPWAISPKPLQRAKELAVSVGCGTESNDAMLKCLKSRPANQIVAAVGKIQVWMFNPFTPFGAVVDEWSTDPVLPKHPVLLLKEKLVYDIPWIVSHTTGEGLYNAFDYYPKENLQYVDEHWNEVMPHILHYNFTIEQSDLNRISAEIRHHYLGNEPLTHENYNKLIDLMGDRLFKVSLDMCTKLHAAATKSSVWHYMFDYRGAHSLSELTSGTTEDIGVSHGDDILYVMKTDFMDTQSTDEDKEMSKLLLDIFLSFASNGKPKTKVNWTPASKQVTNQLRYLRINSPSSVLTESVDGIGNRRFWDSLPFKENENLFRNKDEL